jgi:hypothetical protein
VISDLSASAPDSTSNVLRWTAPADVGPRGKPVEYDLRAAINATQLLGKFPAAKRIPIALVPSAAGNAEIVLLSPLSAADRYFAIRSRDASGNWSSPSFPIERAYPPAPPKPTTVALAVGANPARMPVAIAWQAPADGARELRIHDLGGRLLRRIDLGSAIQGNTRWDGRGPQGSLMPSGVYLLTLIDGPHRATIRIVLLK